MHIYWQDGNSACVGCFIFWVPNTSVDSITYGGVMLTVRKHEPSYFSGRGTQRPARHPRMPATRVLDHPPIPTVPKPLAPSDNWQFIAYLLPSWQSLHPCRQVGNSAYVGCFIFWVPNTSVDSITYDGVMLTVRKPEPSYFSERGTHLPIQ